VARDGGDKPRFQLSQLRITRGALIVAGLELGVSLIWLMANPSARATILRWVVASPGLTWRDLHVWTLATSPLLEPSFIALVMHMVVLWAFVPTLERFWGTPRLYRFVAITSIAGSLGGTLMGLALGTEIPIAGLDPFMYAAIIAFGIVYAKTPVQFFGVLPLTGRQLMYGFLGFLVLYVVLEQAWELGASYAAGMLTAVVMTSKQSPLRVWRRWRLARKRAQLTVLEGGAPRVKSRDEQNYLN
jgi:membrane associated rhomboid family serine protease